jgi:hypothetical protein
MRWATAAAMGTLAGKVRRLMSGGRIFNIFLYFDGGIAREYGVRHYCQHGDDDAKLAWFKALVDADFGHARRFALPRTFTQGEWSAQQRKGMDLGLFDEGLTHYRAGREPLVGLTAIVDGVPRRDVVVDLSPVHGDKVGMGLPGDMDDWLVRYTEGDLFRFDKLINDDYFAAIKLLFNARHVASAAKLLMSCIDTLAFVEHGDRSGNFARWLEDHVDLASLGITAAELWEFRNAIVHMTNLSSRAVLAGKVSPIMPFIGADHLMPRGEAGGMKPFNLYSLLMAVSAGIGKWAETYNADRAKFLKFIERYDTMISDCRLAHVLLGDTPAQADTIIDTESDAPGSTGQPVE